MDLAYYAPNCFKVNPEFKGALPHPICFFVAIFENRVISKVVNLVLRKFRRIACRPSTVIVVLPSFGAAISNIVTRITNPKMGWIHASSIVSIGTVVQNEKSIRDWAEVQNPASSMRLDWSKLVPESSADLAISLAQARSPYPTRISEVYFGEKPFWKRRGKTLFQEVIRCNSELLKIIHSNFGTRSWVFNAPQGHFSFNSNA